MGKREDRYHHSDLRSELLQAAAAMIAEDGAQSVTMRGLAQRVGVSRTAPYRHFADKAALLAAVAEDGFRRLSADIRRARQQNSGDALLALRAMGIAYVGFAVANPTHYRLMFGQRIVSWKAYPGLVAAGTAPFNEVTAIVRMCQQENRIKPGAPLKTAHAVWAAAHGLSLLIIDERTFGPEDILDLADFTFDTLLQGLSSEADPGRQAPARCTC